MRMRVISSRSQSCDRELEALVLTHIQPFPWQHLHTFLYVPTVLLCGSCFLSRHYPPLSSMSGIEKRLFLGIWQQPELIRSLLITRSFLAPLKRPFAWSRTTFCNFCEHNKVMRDIELRVIVLQTGRICQATRRQSWCLFPSRVVCFGETWGTSKQWKLIQCSRRAAAMCGVSRVEDSANRKVLICMPILTLMTL